METENKETTLFFQEFEKLTGAKFSMLKFRDAEFFEKLNLLKVNFNISAFDIKSLTDSDKKEVLNAVEKIFPDLEVSVDYIRTFADEKTVRNKIISFFNSKHQFFLTLVNNDSLNVSVDENSIDVVLKLETPSFRLFKSARIDEELKKALEKEFNNEIAIVLDEIVVETVNKTIEETRRAVIDNNIVVVEDARLILAKTGPLVFASRAKSNQITTLPSYISDIKSPCDYAVLCGKILDFGEKQYKNKRFEADDPSSPEFKTLFRFKLYDKTNTIDCVVFPNSDQLASLRVLKDGDEIICQGKISEGNLGGLSFVVNTIYKAEELDYSSIKKHKSKSAPKNYSFIFPQKYEDDTLYQHSVFDSEQKIEEMPSLLQDKSFVVFDLETTGLDTSCCDIIEIAGVKIENGVITETFSTLINPKCEIPPNITQVTGITNADVEFAPTSDLVLPDFFKFTRGSSLVAHNIGFDFPILRRCSEELGYIYENDLFDTLSLARQNFTGLKSYKLEYLTEHFSILHSNAHRALYDALATSELFRLIAKQIDKNSVN